MQVRDGRRLHPVLRRRKWRASDAHWLALTLVAGLNWRCELSAPPIAAPATDAAGRADAPLSAPPAWLDRDQPLAPRSTVVATANDLLARGRASADAASSVAAMSAAAQLYERLWRIEHVESDGRAAVDAFASATGRAAAAGLVDAACDAERARARLIGELSGDPALLYRELYTASRLHQACDAPWSAALDALRAYRPTGDARAALDRAVESRRAESIAGPHALDANHLRDDRGIVVTPKLDIGPRRKARIVAVEPYGSEDRARIVVTLDGPATYRVTDAAAPNLTLELSDVEPPRAQHDRAVGGLVHRVVGGKGSEQSSARLTFELAAPAYRRVFYLPEPFRIVVDLATQWPQLAHVPRGAPRPVARVAIDAGHGGSDPGAIGPTGLREKDVTLDIAHLAAPILSRELGVLTMLTRDDDRMVPLDARAARANAFHADLFLSIHCNASENRDARGVMSFVLDATREDAAGRIAARENAVSVAASSHVAAMAAGLRLSDVASRSQVFAELVQRAALAALAPRFTGAMDHGVKGAGFFVLAGAEMPSVLFETSFISNVKEEKRLATREYRAKLADAIVNAVRAYREGR